MRPIKVDEVVKATGGTLISKKEIYFNSVGTDSRKNLQGALFIALKGEQFDAHDFIESAVKNQCYGLLVHKYDENVKKLKGLCTIILVQDTLTALQDLANWYRQSLPVKVLSITGSNGKTTTKEFAAALISPNKKLHFNQGSFNNHWGVPLTLLETPLDAEIALVEMGMNHAGEITDLVNIAIPNGVVCTMVGRAHIEFFGTIEKIADAKYEIYEASNTQADRLYNLDCEQTKAMYEKDLKKNISGQMLTFSAIKQEADIYLHITQAQINGLKIAGHIQGYKNEVFVHVFGEQNLVNLQAAAGLALLAGLTPQQIWNNFSYCKTNWGRNQILQTESGANIIFDAYNANPDSMNALMKNVSRLSQAKQKIAIIGEMREMGALSSQLHFELGKEVAQVGFEKVFFIGNFGENFKKGFSEVEPIVSVQIYAQSSDLNLKNELELICHQLNSDGLIVVKGSRGIYLEKAMSVFKPIGFENKK